MGFGEIVGDDGSVESIGYSVGVGVVVGDGVVDGLVVGVGVGVGVCETCGVFRVIEAVPVVLKPAVS